MDYIISYTVGGTMTVEAPTPEAAVSIMRANMADRICGCIDLDTLAIDGIEVEREPNHEDDRAARNYIRRAV